MEESIKQGYDVSGRGYGVLIGGYDNIGFRKRGEEGVHHRGFDLYLVFLIYIVLCVSVLSVHT